MEASKKADGLYESAVEALYSPLHQATSPQSIQDAQQRRLRTLDDMQEYLRRIGLGHSDLPPCCLHITGTKGKGSTAAQCEAILRTRYQMTTGLFTSPHLVDIRERIRIGGRPVSRYIFGKVYFHIRRQLEQYERSTSQSEEAQDPLPVLPGYFRMLTLIALFIFAHQRDPKVQVMILEVGMGGRYDATNVVQSPGKICGITLLDLDHTQILGNTLEQIAWEKGGIFRPLHVPIDHQSFHTLFVLDSNPESVQKVLQRCAEERGGKIRLVGRKSATIPSDCQLGLPGRHQRDNSELAVALSTALASTYNFADVGGEKAMFQALTGVAWPGRCQAIQANDVQLHLDGAHTVQSMKSGLDWFMDQTVLCPASARALVFTCSHERNPVELLSILLAGKFQLVIMARTDVERPSALTKKGAEDMLQSNGLPYDPALQVTTGTVPSWQDSLATVWKHLETQSGMCGARVVASVSVKEALAQLTHFRKTSGLPELSVFVTGSLYLIGSVLSAVGWNEESAKGTIDV